MTELYNLMDYASLRVIWWFLLGILLIGFAVMDGFDLGTAFLIPFAGRTDAERRVVINTVGPVWEGNQVWFILGGGAIFAAWPVIYAVSFSGLYFAMMLVLLCLIIRPVSFKYRSKSDTQAWRTTCDYLLCSCSFAAMLLFGVAVGNAIQGVPFYFDDGMRAFYTGTLFDLLNPFALLSGLLSLSILIAHGANYLAIKTEQEIQKRAALASKISTFTFIILFIIFWESLKYVKGYHIVSSVNYNGASNPLHKTVAIETGAWMNNFKQHSLLYIFPLLTLVSALKSVILNFFGRFKLAIVASGSAIFAGISTCGVMMFPFILPSSISYNSSLTVWDASSSYKTLLAMLIAAIIFMPIILLYTKFVYKVMKGKISLKDISADSNNLY